MTNSNKLLPITNYLNQRIVFDLMAVVDDGFSQVTQVNSRNSSSSEKGAEVEAEFGLSNVLSFFKLGSKAKGSLKKGAQDTSEFTDERVHTPTSLFSKLVEYLEEENLINDISLEADINQIKNGDFVRFESKIEINPMITVLDTMEQIGVLATKFNEPQKRKNTSTSKDDQILKQIRMMRSHLFNEGNMDLIGTINYEDELKAIMPIYTNYFFNNNLSEVIDGNYKVLGKVIKIAKEGESIDLFRNTVFSKIKQDFLGEMSSGLISESEIDIDEFEREIEAPAMLVIPIAIYT